MYYRHLQHYYENTTKILRLYYRTAGYRSLQVTTGHYSYYNHYGLRGKAPWFADEWQSMFIGDQIIGVPLSFPLFKVSSEEETSRGETQRKAFKMSLGLSCDSCLSSSFHSLSFPGKHLAGSARWDPFTHCLD